MSLRTAFMVLTTRCNRSCPYCFYETGYQGRGDGASVLNVDHRLLQALRKAGVGKLILTGGDPLVLPDLPARVGIAAGEGFQTLLLTNGDLLTRDLFHRLKDAGLGSLSISLDAIESGPSFKAPWEALQMIAAETDISKAVITPVTRINLKWMSEIIHRISDMGLYMLLQPVFVPRDGPLHAQYSLSASSPDELGMFLDCIRLWADRYGPSRYVDLLTGFYSGREVRPETCLMGTQAVVIDAGGEVMPCFHRRDLIRGTVHAEDPCSAVESAFAYGPDLIRAPCFGEHCISLFSHL